jgi:hypothetical protein
VRHKLFPFYQIEGYQVKGSADMTSKRTTLELVLSAQELVALGVLKGFQGWS